jgi:hypothetical protein
MSRRICPSCKERLASPFITCALCGWTEAGDRTNAERDRNRCAFDIIGRRCRYVGTIAENTHGNPPFYCRGHFSNRVGAVAMLTLEQSEADTPATFDYSTRALVELTAEEYRKRVSPPPQESEDLLERAAIQDESIA